MESNLPAEPVALSKSAAEKLTLRIRNNGAALFTLIQEAHDRKAWAALGYKSWAAYVDAELPFSRATSYRYLSAASEQDALVAGGGGGFLLREQPANATAMRNSATSVRRNVITPLPVAGVR